MSTSVIKLNWSEASDKSGIRLYNIYRNDILFHQLDDVKYYIYNEEQPATIRYFVVALTNNDKYLKSNEVIITTSDLPGFDALNYTLNFSL